MLDLSSRPLIRRRKEAATKRAKRARFRSSLRHSVVTMLKAAGVSDFIAREIVGHESAAVSRQYTHLTTDDKLAAMQRLPDVTSALKINQPDVTTSEMP